MTRSAPPSCSTAPSTISSARSPRTPRAMAFLYSFDRTNGQTILAKPYVERINWTRGIDQKTGKPLEYDPKLDIQVYSGRQNMTRAEPTKLLCPSLSGGNNYFPPSYSKRTKLMYIASYSHCNESTLDEQAIKQVVYISRI